MSTQAGSAQPGAADSNRNTLRWRLYTHDPEFGDQIVAAIYRIAAAQLGKWSGDLRIGDPFFGEFIDLQERLIGAADRLAPDLPDRPDPGRKTERDEAAIPQPDQMGSTT